MTVLEVYTPKGAAAPVVILSGDDIYDLRYVLEEAQHRDMSTYERVDSLLKALNEGMDAL